MKLINVFETNIIFFIEDNKDNIGQHNHVTLCQAYKKTIPLKGLTFSLARESFRLSYFCSAICSHLRDAGGQS